MRDMKERKCPFCRTPHWDTVEELIELIQKRVELVDANAIYNLGCWYNYGEQGFEQDLGRALELFLRAGELGCQMGCHSSNCNVGLAYFNGRGVERDVKKALHYYELAAKAGSINARHNLGAEEWRADNNDRAVKHFIIAAGGGSKESLDMIRKMFMDGDATKDDYSKALRSYQAYLDEIKTDQRDEAAASSSIFCYY